MASQRTTAWTLLWDALFTGFSAIVGIGGILLSLLLWQIKSDAKLPILWVLLAGGALLWALATLMKAFYDASKLIDSPTIEILKITKPRPPHSATHCIFLLRPRNQLAVNSNVSFHWIDDDGYERDLGIGTVQRQLENGRLEVTLDLIFEEDPDVNILMAGLLGDVAKAKESLRARDRMPASASKLVLQKGQTSAKSAPIGVNPEAPLLDRPEGS